MQRINLRGVGVALVTPFKKDDTIDYESLASLIELQIAGGVDHFVVLATTSEAVTLSCPERAEVADFVKRRVAGRRPLVLGMSNNCTRALVEHVREVDLDGFDAILSVTPYYNKPSQEGIYRHFSALAQASPLPLVLYNVPSRTGRNMTADTTLRLARDWGGKIIGIKEASGDTHQIAQIIANRPDGFQVVSGDDALTHELIRMGAEGVISVVANALPEQFSAMVHATLDNPSSAEADELNRRLLPLCHSLFEECNPSGIKSLLAHMGLAEATVRLPLVETSPALSAKIAAELAAILN